GYNQNVLSSYADAQKYKFNGKELQDELGLNMEFMDFRQYDPAIGRFVVIDPMAEFQRKWNPYHFAYDNPILFNDPSGLIGEEFTGKKKKKDDTEYGGTLEVVKVTATKKKSTGATVRGLLWASVDFIPFAGSIKQIGVGLYEGNGTDVALGVVFLAVDVFTAGEGGALLRVAEVAGEDALKIAAKDEAKEIVEHNLDEIGEGIYEFKYIDEAGDVKDYTGQSKNVEKRLTQHTNAGEKVPIEGTVKKTSVKGGKTAREVAETKKLRLKGGPGGTNGNKVWPVSAKREIALKAKGLW
ncbi:MAG: RHS repeat-associated core domain-containing protein, partial [Flavobacterium sp.]